MTINNMSKRKVNEMRKQELQSYIDRYRDELVNNVIPFWQTHSPDRVHGGFYNYLGRDGKALHTTAGGWPHPRKEVRPCDLHLLFMLAARPSH